MNRQEFQLKFSEVCELFSQIESVSKTTAKTALLSDYYDKEFLKQILLYTYNPYFVYGINKKTFFRVNNVGKQDFDTIFALLDYLKIYNSCDELKDNVNLFICFGVLQNDREWARKVILKDLKIGINIETINKVFPKLIPTFKVALCNTYKSPSDIKSDTVIVQPKLDGVRCVAIIKEDGGVEMFTRNGSKIEGYDEIIEQLSNERRCGIWKGYVLDGEIMGKNFDNTMEGLFAKDIKKEAIFTVFDVMTIGEFVERVCSTPYQERLDKVYSLYDDARYGDDWSGKPLIVPIISGVENNFTRLEFHHNNAVSDGYEGIVIKDPNAPYEFKRTRNWLKYKTMLTDEFTIIDFERGSGKYEDILGAIVVNENGVSVKVGSGFTDEQRDYIWNNQDKLLHTICEVQYQEKTKDGSLRFPVFKKFRDDK